MLRRPIVLVGAIAAVLVLLLAACGGGDDTESTPSPGASTAAESTGGAGSAAPSYPVTVEADNGSVTIERAPKRIVSLSATATETLFAIGAGDQVAAVDDQSNFPDEAPHTDLSSFQPNVEAIAGYSPDLVLAAYDPGGLVDGLGRVDIPVILEDAAAELDEAYEQIDELGQVTGHVDEARSLADEMKSEIDDLIETATPAAEGRTVYHELGPDFYSATSKTFIGSIYAALGLANIADEAKKAGSGYPQLSAEYIVAKNPDLIVLADTKCCAQTAQTVAARPGWKRIDAVADGNVLEADDDVTSRWGPRTVDFVRLVVDAVARLESR